MPHASRLNPAALPLVVGLLLAGIVGIARAQLSSTGGTAVDPVVNPNFPEWVIEPMGAWGGPVNAFEKHGDIGFLGSGQRLVILDLSDLTDVRELGAVKLGTPVMDFMVRDGLVYVVTLGGGNSDDAGIRASGFHVIDAADPARPELIWSDPDTEFHGVAIDGFYGDYAFLRSQSGNWVADLTDPRSPVLVDNGLDLSPFPGLSVGINDMVIHGDLAFVATTETIGRLRIFDLSTTKRGVWPMEPLHIGSVSFLVNRFAYKVAVEGGWAYVAVKDTAAEQEVLWAVDVSDPASPVRHGSFDGFVQFSSGLGAFNIHELSIEGGRLYAANGAKAPDAGSWDQGFGLATFDIATDPGQPALIATHKTHGSVRGVTAEGDTVYLRDMGEGLIVMDAADPADPARLGGYHSPAQPDLMQRVGDLLYVGDPWNGLSILDVSDLSRPTLLGVHQTPERLGLGTSGLAYLDGHIHLAAGRAGLEVIDVSDPADPVLRGAWPFPDESWLPQAVAADALPGGMKAAYLSVVIAPSAWVFSIDVSDPASPAQLDRSPLRAPLVATFVRASAPGRFFAAPTSGGTPFVLDGADPFDLQSGEIAGLSGDNVVRLDYDSAAGRLYLADDPYNETPRVVAMDMENDWAGVEINALEMNSVGGVASHPEGVVLLGRNIEGADQGTRVALLDMAPPSLSRVIATECVSLDADGPNILRILASDDGAIFVAGRPSGLTKVGGLETFSLRRTPDRNRDGVVNTLDLWVFLNEFGRGDAAADLNRDGRVDRLDIEMYLRLMTGSD